MRDRIGRISFCWRSWVGGAWRVRAGTALSYTHLELEVELEAVLAVNRDAPLLAV